MHDGALKGLGSLRSLDLMINYSVKMDIYDIFVANGLKHFQVHDGALKVLESLRSLGLLINYFVQMDIYDLFVANELKSSSGA